MSDAWDFYVARVNDAPSSLFVDLGVRAEAPVPGRPWLLWIWLELTSPRADGWSSDEEAAALREIEDALHPELEKVCSAAFVGCITGSGRRELYYYAASAEGFETCTRRQLQRFPEYRFELGQREDAEWKLYLDLLYPGPTDLARIQNRHVVEKLAEHGDRASLPRRIDHWAYFPTPEARASFAASIPLRGFSVVGEKLQADAALELPYGLQFMREDTAEWEVVNELTETLSELAEQYEGDYDGWECPVTFTSANDQGERK
jgi:regulator of RNase E activity RraB